MLEILGLINTVGKTFNLGELFKGKEKKLQEFQLALAKELHSANSKQIELNKVEAQHKNIFVAGWRPFIGWVCGTALLYNFILQPLLYILIDAFGGTVDLPKLEIAQLISILLAMLGMSGYRTYEKIKLNNKVK